MIWSYEGDDGRSYEGGSMMEEFDRKLWLMMEGYECKNIHIACVCLLYSTL